MHGTIQTPDHAAECMRLITERCGVAIHELQTSLADNVVCITGIIGSWHGKQLASETARSLYPQWRIDNRLRVVRTR